ncbi:MAG: hypothetical protein JRJ29_20945 [Deltaproteobacteria bacterium]|nr:hypothetical protein [Deltaproteobacteria bacterium]
MGYVLGGLRRGEKDGVMAGVEIFPAGLLAKDKEEEVIIFLRTLPIPARRKKELIAQWAKYVGAALTRDMVEKVLGPLAGRV